MLHAAVFGVLRYGPWIAPSLQAAVFCCRYRHLQASVLLVVIAEKPKDHAAETKQVYHWMN